MYGKAGHYSSVPVATRRIVDLIPLPESIVAHFHAADAYPSSYHIGLGSSRSNNCDRIRFAHCHFAKWM